MSATLLFDLMITGLDLTFYFLLDTVSSIIIRIVCSLASMYFVGIFVQLNYPYSIILFFNSPFFLILFLFLFYSICIVLILDVYKHNCAVRIYAVIPVLNPLFMSLCMYNLKLMKEYNVNVTLN